MAEYEVLILAMKEAKDLGVEQLVIFGDFELVIKQARDLYKVKNVKLKNYRNEVWSLIEQYFSTFNLNHISREINELVDSLEIVSSNFKVPLDVKDTYDV